MKALLSIFLLLGLLCLSGCTSTTYVGGTNYILQGTVAPTKSPPIIGERWLYVIPTAGKEGVYFWNPKTKRWVQLT